MNCFVCVVSGIWDQLLISSKPHPRKTSTLQTVRMQRSPLLDQVQAFLPQMAQANEKLRREMAAAPAGHFNIENIDETSGNIIQMDVALFEMSRSDSKEEDSPEESSRDSSGDSSESEEDVCVPSEVTIENIKLPNAEGGKGKIEILDSPASKKRSSEMTHMEGAGTSPPGGQGQGGLFRSAVVLTCHKES